MMTATTAATREVQLAELIDDFKPGFAVGERDQSGVLQIRMNNVGTDGGLDLSDLIRVPATAKQVSDCSLAPGDVLFNNTNSTELVGKSALFVGHGEPVTYSNHFTRLRTNPKRLEPRYLARWLTRLQQTRVFEGLCTRWVGQSAVKAEKLLNLRIPLPPLSEQRRIADILDKADGVRQKRREVLAQTVLLKNTVFRDLFGDISRNDRNWPVTAFKHVLTEQGFRNGVSPSRSGSYFGKVLVLSAITGSQFDHTATKEGMFTSPAKAEQLVSANDFLICRGNGNIRLVGVGQFPTSDMNETVFPDTIIAASIDRSRVTSHYLQQAWRSGCVRSQIESGARTTNGTYKVNQGLLGSITLPLPPVCEQQRFASVNEQIIQMIKRLQCNEPDELFASLLQRSFKGEL